MFQDVKKFYCKFKLPQAGKPRLLEDEEYLHRYAFLDEELEEFCTACEKHDLAGAADALVDIVYVAMGTAVQMGLPWEKLWREIHSTNMQKVRGKSARNEADVVKPAGWKPPRVKEIIDEQLGPDVL